MPRVRKRLPARRHDDLSEIVRMKLDCGHWYDFLSGATLDMEDLAAVWLDHRETILASYKASSWSEDQPCWGQYVFDLVPAHGQRRGTDEDDTDHGYYVDPRDGAEPWATYLRRIGAA